MYVNVIERTLLQFCKLRLLHVNLKWNHFTEICCYNTDVRANDTDEVFGSEVLSSGKDVFLVCSMRQCMTEVWLGCNWSPKSKPSGEAR